jgi:hypothetical protein
VKPIIDALDRIRAHHSQSLALSVFHPSGSTSAKIMSAPKRAHGRPRERTDRWYSLLALTYIWAVAAARDKALTAARESRGLLTRARLWVAVEATLRESGVTGALQEAEKLGLFTRDPVEGERSKTKPYGRLTSAGWEALGPEIPAEWRVGVGATWDVPINLGSAEKAIRILGKEVRSERMRRPEHAQEP